MAAAALAPAEVHMDWSRFTDQFNGPSDPDAQKDRRTLAELRAYAAVYERLLEAGIELRRRGRTLRLDEGGRHIFVLGELRTVGVHRDNKEHRIRVSGPGRFGSRDFPIPDAPDALEAWSTEVAQAALEMLLQT
jgi:hypothetical protein